MMKYILNGQVLHNTFLLVMTIFCCSLHLNFIHVSVKCLGFFSSLPVLFRLSSPVSSFTSLLLSHGLDCSQLCLITLLFPLP